jgi:predicted O-methyltransferase YrrM
MKKKRYEVLQELINDNGFKLVVEIGTANGKTAGYLLNNNKDIKLYCVDPYIQYDNDANGQKDKLIKNKQLAQKCFSDDRCVHIEKLSSEAVNCFDDNVLDLVFIDGNHSYEYVFEDIKLWWKKIRSGGVLSGHDYCKNHRGVVEAVNRFVYENKFILRTDDSKMWYIKKI